MIDSDEAVDLEIYPVYPCFQEKPMEKPMENRPWHEFPFRPIIPPKNNQADVEKLAYQRRGGGSADHWYPDRGCRVGRRHLVMAMVEGDLVLVWRIVRGSEWSNGFKTCSSSLDDLDLL